MDEASDEDFSDSESTPVNRSSNLASTINLR